MTPSNAGLGPRVKPLEWQDEKVSYGPETYEAETPVGRYQAFADEDSAAGQIGLEWSWDSQDFGTTRATLLGKFADFDLAQAAAQADYEARILSAIDQSHLLRSLEEARVALEPFAAVTERPHFKHVHDEQRLFIETNAEVVVSEDVRGRDFRRARAALSSLQPSPETEPAR